MTKPFAFLLKIVYVFLIACSILAVATLQVAYASADSIVALQILTVNDFHGALQENGKNPGAAKLVEFLNKARSKNAAGTLVLSAGDMFQGSPDSNLLYGKTVVDIMNYAGFDAMTLGNHEFDWGVDILRKRMSQSSFPYVCANIFDKHSGKRVDFVRPYVILERKGVKIGVIGIATPETAIKTNPRMIADYTFADPATVVSTLVPELKKQGADIVVVLTHLGSFRQNNGTIAGEAAQLAVQTSGIDAIVSGHSHQEVYGKLNDIPIVQALYNGRAIGEIELIYNAGTHEVIHSSSSVLYLPTQELQEDAGAKEIIDTAQKEIEPIKNTIIGKTVRPLSHDRYQMGETVLGQWVTDVMRQAVHADIAFANIGGLRTGIAPGVITMGSLYESMPFDNTLCVVEMSGSQIIKVLEYGLLNTKIGMLQYSGLHIKYPSSLENKQFSVTLDNGRPFCLDKSYKVVINDFMAAGGDGYTMFSEGKNIRDTGILVRDVVADKIRRQKVVDVTGDNRFSFAAEKLKKAS